MASSFSFLTLFVLFCVYIPIGTMSFSMKLIPRVNFDSILFPKNISLEEKHNRLVQLSKIHALKYQMNNTNAISPQTFQPLVPTISNIYAVEMRIGTPPFTTLLMFDTGSSDTWVQCLGCTKCFPLKGENFKYQASNTFKEVPCEHPLCDPKKCSDGKCEYAITYADGAKSKGILLFETFNFPPGPSNIVIDKRFLSFKGVVFGCGLQSEKMTFGVGVPMTDNNVIGGMFGLGPEPRSFLKQLKAETNMRFSYCLGQFLDPQSHNYLHFGPDAKISGDFKTTSLVPTIGSLTLIHYHVVCKGISLDGNKLPIDPKLFEVKSDGSGGFILDTGAYATILVQSAYQVLKQRVMAYFQQKGLSPSTEKKLSLDLCYLNPPPNIVKPTITYHFDGGADFVVAPESGFLSAGDGRNKVFCLAVLGHNDFGNILGVINQADHTFLFDVGKNQVSFTPKAKTCSK
ncbi:putative nepenthesin [Medicago truncatula]|uniref:Eukaryotic aspartyl protease family protein n=1 Tax=Medicago truncatula TaxID=3880 RepID=A0A072V9D5_MEDTR|nr:aspartic proteinase nepenthesin-1 [Medicago truncatula]KEH38402.1 eukaryotic aspartyl protease family protein [Medicago truncatula]RHN74677.1 putative nepenthesin [Medicago truncatula]